MTSPIRTAWPGRKVTSRESPFRLLSSPSTATRCAIGVVPAGTRVTVCGTSTVSMVSFSLASRSGAPVGPQPASTARPVRSQVLRTRSMPQSGVHA